jgi:hypothetical protein
MSKINAMSIAQSPHDVKEEIVKAIEEFLKQRYR